MHYINKKFRDSLIKVSCITTISKEEYDAIQIANRNSLIIKIIILLAILGLVIFILYRFKKYGKYIILGLATLSLLGGGLYYLHMPITADVAATKDTMIAKTLEEKEENTVKVGCGENLRKEWWEF